MLLQSAPLILAQTASAPNSTTTQKTSVSSGKDSSFNEMLTSFKEPEVKEKTLPENKTSEKDVHKKVVAKNEDRPSTEKTEKTERVEKNKNVQENDLAENLTDEEKSAIAISEMEIENILAGAKFQESDILAEAATISDVAIAEVQMAEDASSVQYSAVLQTLISEKLTTVEDGNFVEQEFVVLGDADTFPKLLSGQKIESVAEKKNNVAVDTEAEKLLAGAENKNVKADIAMAKYFSSSEGSENNQEKFNGNTENGRNFKFDSEGKITVSDFRTKFDAEISSAQNVNTDNVSTTATSTVKISSVSEQKNVSGQSVNTVQMNMNLAQMAEQNILSSNSQTASATGSDFHAMLTNQIRENASEFVKAGSIVLRDGNMGEINLTLNPENLGNVKISLQLSDKLITGQITAFTREAFNAFRESADNLRQAFVQSGFEMSGFDISWSGQDAQQGGFAESQSNEARHFAASKTYGDYVSGIADESLVREYNGYSDYRVNVTA